MANLQLMSSSVKKYLQIILFATAGILMFWLAYRGQDVSSLISALDGAHWEYVLAAGVANVLSHYFRALRWDLLLSPLGYITKKSNLFLSVMVMYFANLAIPRSGEVVRCGIVNRYENVTFATALGTVAAERVADLVAFAILTLWVLGVQASFVGTILENNPEISANVGNIFGSLPILIIVFAFVIAFFVILCLLIVKKNIFGIGDKIKNLWSNFKAGLTAILKLENKFLFLFYTISIWFIYFFTLYLVFLAFDFTSHLSFFSAMTLSVLGTFGVVVPSPGGIGTWHFIAIEILYIWGINRNPDGGAYALVAHGVQDLTFIVVGVVSLWLLPFINKNGKHSLS